MKTNSEIGLPYRVDWMNMGREEIATQQDRDRWLSAIAAIDFNGISDRPEHDHWFCIPAENCPMSQGMGIQSMIRELRLPRPAWACFSSEFAPYSLLGVRCSYKRAGAMSREDRHTVDAFAIDRGSDLLMVCARVYESEVTP